MSVKSGKEKHPLFNSWSHAKRKHKLCTDWQKDFWKFVSEVGERPAEHRIFAKDETKLLAADNFVWKQMKQSIKDYESRNAYMREYMRLNKDKQKDADLKKRFGISVEDYKRKQEEQNNLCAICGNPEQDKDSRSNKARALAVDHNHTTGQIRKLLCRGCNQGLGNFQENIQRLQKAIEYLQQHEAVPSNTLKELE